MEQPFYSVRLLEKTMLTKDIMQFRLEKPAGFTFLAGQFVQFRIQDGDTHVLRSYSISSAPDESYLEFCTKILPGGKASTFFSELSIGSPAYISAAKGNFTVQKDGAAKLYFIATGTGITPVISMIGATLTATTASVPAPVLVTSPGSLLSAGLLSVADPVTVTLLFGVRSEADIFWHERLADWQKAHPQFRYHLTLSQPANEWAGSRGRVTAHLGDCPSDASYYVCGSVEMVKDVRKILLERGVNTKSIHFEIF